MMRWFADRGILGFLGRGGHGKVGVATAEEINHNCTTGSISSFFVVEVKQIPITKTLLLVERTL